MSTQKQPAAIRRVDRRGAALVELAIVLPVLILLVAGAIDVGQFINVAQVVNEASRVGARRATRNTLKNVSEVKTAVQDHVHDAFPNVPTSTLDAALAVDIRNGSGAAPTGGDITTIGSGSSVSVQVAFEYDAVRWVALFTGLKGMSTQTTTVMRRE